MIVWEEPCDLLNSAWQTIVCPVNCVGAMGAGLALAMAKRDRQLESYYHSLCKMGLLKVGTVHYFAPSPFKRVLLFPTKDDWRQGSELSYIEEGLKSFVASYEHNAITSILFPAIGCGYGGLAWEDVRSLLYRYLDPLPIMVGIALPIKWWCL